MSDAERQAFCVAERVDHVRRRFAVDGECLPTVVITLLDLARVVVASCNRARLMATQKNHELAAMLFGGLDRLIPGVSCL